MRRLFLILVILVGVVVASAAPASAAYRVVTISTTSHATLSVYGFGSSPPRGRAVICMSDNRNGLVTQIEARVKYHVGISLPNQYTPWVVRRAPVAGSCATGDDFEWYYTRRAIDGGQFRIWTATSEQFWVCSTLSCYRSS